MRVAPALVAAALGVPLACAETVPPERPPAVSGPAATTILEPPRLEIGETAAIDVAVAVPPGAKVGPVETPRETPGLWVLAVSGPTVERTPEREVHRTRFRVRAKETGDFAWPASRVSIDLANGTEQVLDVPARPFRVHTVAHDVPDQLTFFSYRSPALLGEERGGGGVLLPALVGAALALAGVGLVGWVRRARRVRDAPPAEPAPSQVPWRSAQAALAAAAEVAESDLPRAADMASAALRVFVDHRFHTRTTRATSEELRASEAPFLLTTRWERLLELLERFDALRFPPPAANGGADPGRLRAAVEDAQAFVRDATPRGNAMPASPAPGDAAPSEPAAAPSDAEPAAVPGDTTPAGPRTDDG